MYRFLLSGGLRHLVRFPQPPDTPVTLLTDSALLVVGIYAKSNAELLHVRFVCAVCVGVIVCCLFLVLLPVCFRRSRSSISQGGRKERK